MTEAPRPGERGCALVTGASGGIGAAISRGLAADGWPVGVHYRSRRDAAEQTAEQIRAAGGEAVVLGAELDDPAAAEELCEQVESALGRPLLALVNNAGITRNGLLLQIDEDAWGTVIETNLSAAARLTRRALRSMLRARFGRVVNVASVAASRPSAGQSNYAASKAGLVGFTKAVAVEVARRPITVNAVAPGFVDTAMTASVPTELLSSIPAGRLGAPEEVAACVRFLASEAAGYVTGSVLTVDGGLTA